MDGQSQGQVSVDNSWALFHNTLKSNSTKCVLTQFVYTNDSGCSPSTSIRYLQEMQTVPSPWPFSKSKP